MDRIQRHLDAVPLDMIAIFGGLAVVAAFLMPKRFGFYTAVFLMTAWLNLNRFQGIPMLASVTKVTYWLPPVLLIFFASFLPGPRRAVPPLTWLYLLCPFFGAICVLGANDVLLGIVQFSAMFLYAAAAIALYRVTTSSQDLVRVVVLLFLGILVPIAISFSALIIFRGAAFRPGIGRFEPFGVGSNQYVHFLATACAFAGCGFITLRTKWMRLTCLGVIGACGAMLIASGSRQGLVIVLVSMLPAIRWGMKNPITLVIGAIVGLGAGVWLFTFTDNVGDAERITDFSDTSGRFETFMEYLHILQSRPMGLLGTSGHSVNRDESAGHITHNSYLRLAYVGGLPLLIPLLVVAAVSLSSMIYVLKNKQKTYINHTLLATLAALLLAIYLQGLVNDMIYISISSWTFLHFFLSCFFMGLARELKQQESLAWQSYGRGNFAMPTH